MIAAAGVKDWGRRVKPHLSWTVRNGWCFHDRLFNEFHYGRTPMEAYWQYILRWVLG